VQVVDHQHEPTGVIGELRQHSIDHLVGVKPRRGAERLLHLAPVERVSDGLEQREPEQLLILLVARYRDESDWLGWS
jgi:hypothetical protein